MAIAAPTQRPREDDSPELTPASPIKAASRIRPWMIVTAIVLALALGVGGYYAVLIRNAFSTIHTVTTPAAAISGSTLGGPASISIDTSAAKTAVAQAASGIQTPTPGSTSSIVLAPTLVQNATVPGDAATQTAVTVPASQPTAMPTVATTPMPTATPSVTPSQIERIVNGGFENGTDGWNLQSGAVVNGDQAHSGKQALDLVAHGGYAGQRIFFVPGSSYQLTFWARVNGGGQPSQASIVFFDASETAITGSKPPVVMIASKTWQQQTVTYNVPKDAAAVEIHFWNPANSAITFIDDVSVRGLVSTAKVVAGSAGASDGSQLNILVMGVDARPGEAIDIGVRPDSLMVVHLDKKAGTCRVLAIPRDTRTDLPGYGLTKINHALAVGGISYESLVVQNLLGLKINHFLLIDFNGFQSLVDSVGGITVTVPGNFTATDGTVFTAGVQGMSGQQALSYARYRGGPDGDFGRIGRQQQVLRALVARASGLNIVRSLNELLPAVQDNVRTDLSAKEMAGLASDFRSHCTQDNVTMLSLDGTTATYQDPLLNLPLNYVILDPDEIKAKVAALLEP